LSLPNQTHLAAIRLYREAYGRILATLVRLLGDFGLAEECLQEAFATALKHWPDSGVPGQPRAWLIQTARNKAIAQRLVRTKRKIREAGIAYRIPEAGQLPERIDGVLSVLYLIFNEGYSATSGDALLNVDLSSMAIALARDLFGILPNPEVGGLLALMLLHDARRAARTDAEGDLVMLEEQDRRKWNRAQITEGERIIESVLRQAPPGPYALQAAIAAVHAQTVDGESTDWPQIVALYDRLLAQLPSPVVELNRAVAVAMAEGCEQGLRLIDAIAARDVLRGYYPLHAARADLLRRLGRHGEAAVAYARVRVDAEYRGASVPRTASG